MGILTRKISAWTSPIVNEEDRPNRPAAQMKQIFDSNSNELKEALNGIIDDLRAGDADIAFTEAETKSNIESGDTLATMLGKIRRWIVETMPVIQTVKTDQGDKRFLRGDGIYAVPEIGEAGNGLPAGGTTGQALLKKTAEDFDSEWGTITPSMIGAEKARLERTATLQASAWVSNAQTIPVSGVTVSSLVVVSAAPASHVAYGEAGVYCSAQAKGSLTFSCSDVPTEDLSVNVVIWR